MDKMILTRCQQQQSRIVIFFSSKGAKLFFSPTSFHPRLTLSRQKCARCTRKMVALTMFIEKKIDDKISILHFQRKILDMQSSYHSRSNERVNIVITTIIIILIFSSYLDFILASSIILVRTYTPSKFSHAFISRLVDAFV